MNSAEQLIFAAVMQLEEEESFEGAEKTLREAIELATVASHPVELIRAKALLGEILLNTSRETEAAVLFREVLHVPEGVDPSLLEEETETARTWLRELGVEGH
ncbi:MAG: hypothetical protein ABR517_06480 [Thermoanaerobaculia bacterium]